VRNGRTSALATYRPEDRSIVKIHRKTVSGIAPRNAEQSFAVHALCNPAVALVTVSGKAGTGKTLLALAAALEQRTRIARSCSPGRSCRLSNKDIGYLPGDIQSKISPYMQPLYDNLA
jgi:PhoH-like ATPase